MHDIFYIGIPSEFWCDEDGIWDCPDGSDEQNCTFAKRIAKKVKQK